ncbi:hypothetical protein ACSYGO_07675 [Streptomyces krungchingensis]
MELDRRLAGPDAELDDPLGGRRPVLAAAFFFGLPRAQRRDLGVDALYLEQMPGAQGGQVFQVRRQIIEHIFDFMPAVTRLALACSILCSISWGWR